MVFVKFIQFDKVQKKLSKVMAVYIIRELCNKVQQLAKIFELENFAAARQNASTMGVAAARQSAAGVDQTQSGHVDMITWT